MQQLLEQEQFKALHSVVMTFGYSYLSESQSADYDELYYKLN